MSDIQSIVDALAAGLGRPVGVDDRRYRAVAYSSHSDAVDEVRLASILKREAPHEAIEWLKSLGIPQARRFVRVPANAKLGMAARVCLPIRFEETLLGYVWLVDEPVALSDSELAEPLRCATELGAALYRQLRLHDDDRKRERDLLERLVGRRGADATAAAATELLRDGLLASASAYAALVLHAFHDDIALAPDQVRIRLAAAAEDVRRAVAPRHLLAYAACDQIVAVLACEEPGEAPRRGRALAQATAKHLADSPGWRLLVGLGDERADAAELAVAHREAQQALSVARAIGADDPLVRWSELGAYRTLAPLLDGRDPAPLLPAALVRLLAAPAGPELARTLACYLDRGGDARIAAERLHLHRSTLYARLHRIEAIAGVDLHRGEDRLELHVGLRLWLLAGVRGDRRDSSRPAGPAHATPARG